MSRYATDFSIGKPDDFVQFVTEDFFTKEGFTRETYKTGEVVWTKGMGLATSPQFYKVESHDGQVHLEAWMAAFALPGIPLGETGITGFWGWAVKKVMRDRVDHLKQLLAQDVPIPAGYAAASAEGGQPAAAPAQPSAAQEPIPVLVHNPTDKATISLVLGIVSIAACLLPYFGVLVSIVCGCIAISTGRVGKKSTQPGKAQAGFVMGIVGVCLGGLSFLWNIVATVFSFLVFLA